MENLFLKLMNMSITAGWIVLAVVLLRLLLKKAPKWVSCILWALVGLRLVLPFSFESEVSVIPSSETIPQNIVYAENPEIQSGVEVFNSAVNPIISESLSPQAGASVNPVQVILFAASCIWIAGMAVMVIYAIVSYLRIRHKVRVSVPEGDNVLICDNISTPFILGLIKPKIYLPSNISEEEKKHIIAHEKAHIKRLDYIWKPLGFGILTVYWFNPLMWLAYVLLCRDIELACDQRVIKNMDKEGKKEYSKALLECSIPRRTISACPLAFGEVGVKQRIKSVLNYKKPAFWIVIAALAACIIASVCLLTDPIGEKGVKIHNTSCGDVEKMNIGAEMPYIQYADDNKMIFSGSFGVIIYNYRENKVVNRITHDDFRGSDLEVFNIAVSKDGKTIYIGEIYNSYFSYEYDIEGGRLTELSDKVQPDFFVADEMTEEQRALLNPFYINGWQVYNTEKVYFYLRSKDWNMKNLCLVWHYIGYDMVAAAVPIFPEYCDNALLGENTVTYYYNDSVDPTPPYFTLDDSGRFKFVSSWLSSYIGWGRYELRADGTLTMRTDDGINIYVFHLTEDGFAFDAEKSSEITGYRYSPNSEVQYPVTDGALFSQ